MPETSRQATNQRFSQWLRARMEASGYETTGPRAGGQARLAEDAKLTTSILSRALNGQSVPSIDALISLSRVLGTAPSEALHAAGHHAVADLLVKIANGERVEPEKPDNPVTARIQHAEGLTPEARAWLHGFATRRYERMVQDLATEVDDLIRFMGGSGLPVDDVFTALERAVAATTDLTDEQRSELEERLRKQIAGLDILAATKADRKRRAASG